MNKSAGQNRSLADLADNRGIIVSVTFDPDKDHPSRSWIVVGYFAIDREGKVGDSMISRKYSWSSDKYDFALRDGFGGVRRFRSYGDAQKAALDFGYAVADDLDRSDLWMQSQTSIFDILRANEEAE